LRRRHGMLAATSPDDLPLELSLPPVICRVSFVVRAADGAPRVAAIGGRQADGVCWMLDEAAAIAAMERGVRQFHITSGARNIWLTVARGRDGRCYLKSEADGEVPDSLLALPERATAPRQASRPRR